MGGRTDEIWKMSSVGRRRNGEGAEDADEVVDIEFEDIDLFGTAGGSGSEAAGVGYVEGEGSESLEVVASDRSDEPSSSSASGGCSGGGERGVEMGGDIV